LTVLPAEAEDESRRAPVRRNSRIASTVSPGLEAKGAEQPATASFRGEAVGTHRPIRCRAGGAPLGAFLRPDRGALTALSRQPAAMHPRGPDRGRRGLRPCGVSLASSTPLRVGAEVRRSRDFLFLGAPQVGSDVQASHEVIG
jgi:hypothetical protein